MVLMLWQRNEVIGAIRAARLDPKEFEWEPPTDGGDEFVIGASDLILRHKPTGYYFSFSTVGDEHRARFSPGRNVLEEEERTVVWSNQLDTVRTWLNILNHELSEPDLWAELARGRQVVGDLTAVENSPFTAEERQQIADQLREIKALLIRKEGLEGERLRAVEAGLDGLEEASTRLGRRDWLTIFYGTVFAWGLSAVLPPDALREVLVAIGHGLGHLFGGDIPQLPAPP